MNQPWVCLRPLPLFFLKHPFDSWSESSLQGLGWEQAARVTHVYNIPGGSREAGRPTAFWVCWWARCGRERSQTREALRSGAQAPLWEALTVQEDEGSPGTPPEAKLHTRCFAGGFLTVLVRVGLPRATRSAGASTQDCRALLCSALSAPFPCRGLHGPIWEVFSLFPAPLGK